MNKLLARRPSPALVVALVAVFSSLASGATAAKLITGKQIAKKTITGKNVKPKSLTGKHVKDGSLAKKDFKKGVLAAAGIAGPQGPRGADGAEGPAGREGADGAEGAEGPAGPDGPRGPDGPEGRVGPMGPAGPAGANGVDGARGPLGPVGPQGETGPKGAQGPEGPEGAEGPEGSEGPEGVEGPEGPMGPPGGNVIASGYHSLGASLNLASGTNDFLAPAFTASASGVCVVTAQVAIDNQGASASNTAGLQTVRKVDGGSTTSDGGWTNYVMADGDSEGSASKTATHSITAGSTYQFGVRVSAFGDSVGDSAFPTVTYFCL